MHKISDKDLISHIIENDIKLSDLDALEKINKDLEIGDYKPITNVEMLEIFLKVNKVIEENLLIKHVTGSIIYFNKEKFLLLRRNIKQEYNKSFSLSQRLDTIAFLILNYFYEDKTIFSFQYVQLKIIIRFLYNESQYDLEENLIQDYFLIFYEKIIKLVMDLMSGRQRLKTHINE